MMLEYVRGLCWVAQYYFQGVPSWHWYYPYHYAPFACDLRQLGQQPVVFDLGQPVTPLTQLMSVLPAASSHCLPAAYANLMSDPASPIIDFYPEDFALDPNGKPPALRWLWVARLPFIDAARLNSELTLVSETLTDGERRRNTFGQAMLLLSALHPGAGGLDPGQAGAAQDDWIPNPATQLAGLVRQPQETSGVSGVFGMEYEHPPKCFHSSALHEGAADRVEPIAWEVLEASLPRKAPRLPMNDAALETMLRGHRVNSVGGRGGRGGRGASGGGRGGGRGGGGGGGRNASSPAAGRGGRSGAAISQPCRFSAAGTCTHGASCRFAHVP